MVISVIVAVGAPFLVMGVIALIAPTAAMRQFGMHGMQRFQRRKLATVNQQLRVAEECSARRGFTGDDAAAAQNHPQILTCR